MAFNPETKVLLKSNTCIRDPLLGFAGTKNCSFSERVMVFDLSKKDSANDGIRILLAG